MSWIFPPSSVFTTRAHRYKAESLLPRFALVFGVGLGLGMLFDSSREQPALSRNADRAQAAPVARAAQARAEPSSPGSGAPPAAQSASAASKKAEAPAGRPPHVPSGPNAPATAAGVPPPGQPSEAKPVREAGGMPTAAAEPKPPKAAAGAAEKAADKTVEAEDPPQARRPPPTRRTTRARAKARSSDPPGLRYVGTRLLPDGSRIPVYRRVRDEDFDRGALGYAGDDRPVRRSYRSPFAFDPYD